jgi:hypothetical protein
LVNLDHLFLFAFRRQSLNVVLIAACLCLCYSPVQEAIHAYRLTSPRTAEARRQAVARAQVEEASANEKYVRVHMQGSFKQIVVQQAQGSWRDLSSADFYLESILGDVFSLFLLGLYVGRLEEWP